MPSVRAMRLASRYMKCSRKAVLPRFNALGAGDEAREFVDHYRLEPLRTGFNALGAGDEAREGASSASIGTGRLVSMPSVRAMRLARRQHQVIAKVYVSAFQCPRCGR